MMSVDTDVIGSDSRYIVLFFHFERNLSEECSYVRVTDLPSGAVNPTPVKENKNFDVHEECINESKLVWNQLLEY